MDLDIYRVSFTVGGLYYQEAIKASDLYFQKKDWSQVRRIIRQENVFQSRTTASSDRTIREVIPRLVQLSDEQLRILIDGNRRDQNQILWVSVCKRYQLIKEFAIEVIHEKLFRLDPQVTYRDFDSFYDAKAEWHKELAIRTAMTRKKLRRVLFQMLHEAEILSEGNQIVPAIFSPRVARSIITTDATLYATFPITEADFRRQANR